MIEVGQIEEGVVDVAESVSTQGEEEVLFRELELESVDYFSSFAQMMGFQKSIGQIYGLLFVSIDPIPMDAVVSRLGISKGSASQGLNVLKSLGAVYSLRIEGERCDHFEANFDVSRMVQHFLEEKLGPRIGNGEARIERMLAIMDGLPSDSHVKEVSFSRLRALRKWQNRASGLLPLIRKFFTK